MSTPICYMKQNISNTFGIIQSESNFTTTSNFLEGRCSNIIYIILETCMIYKYTFPLPCSCNTNHYTLSEYLIYYYKGTVQTYGRSFRIIFCPGSGSHGIAMIGTSYDSSRIVLDSDLSQC